MKNLFQYPKISIVLLFVGLIALYACDRNELLSSSSIATTANDDITVEDGVLKFSSQKQFDDTMTELSKNSDELAKFSKKFPNFISLRQAYDDLTVSDFEKMSQSESVAGYENIVTIKTDEGGEREIVRIIPATMIAEAVNKNGLVIIGKTLQKYCWDKIVAIDDYDAQKINLLLKGQIPAKSTVFKIEHKSKSTNKNARGNDRNCDEYWKDNSKRRLCGDIDYSTMSAAGYTARTSITFATKHQTRTLGTIWYGSNTKQMSLSGTATSAYGFTYNLNESGKETSSVSRSTFGGDPIIRYSTTHEGLRLDGGTTRMSFSY